jgi:hypothetical protein
MKLAPMFAQLVSLEAQICEAAKAADPRNAMRRYEWRPSRYPQLPAIWNWIDDGTYEIDDTARATNRVIITVTIGVKPADLDATMGQLVTLTDHAMDVLDAALWDRNPLSGTARTAKRITIATRIDEWLVNANEAAPVMCMDLPVQVELSKLIQPTA